MRSLATRRQNLATSAVLADVLELLRYAGFDLIVVETAGIGQSDSEIVDLVDVPLYVMTSEYGAASQLEKIDMLDFAELIALNKFEKRGAEDALREAEEELQKARDDLAAEQWHRYGLSILCEAQAETLAASQADNQKLVEDYHEAAGIASQLAVDVHLLSDGHRSTPAMFSEEEELYGSRPQRVKI
jgi:putative protein kinase ArgK-like GTPase of G3E family